MLIVLLLLAVRVIPFDTSIFFVRILLYIYLFFSQRSRRQLLKAKKTLGQNRYSSSVYVKRIAFNVAVMARMGTPFTRRLVKRAIIEGEEYLKALKDSNGSAVVATFHYGPWELLAEVFTSRDYKLAALVTRQSKRSLDRFLVALRRRAGLKIVHDIKQATALTRKGFFMASLFDRTIRAKGNHMNFPYPDYRTSRLPLILAARIRRPILPIMCRFMERRLEVKIGSPGQTMEELREFYTPFFSQTPFEWLVWGD